jgi:glycosyltransferase involved in cell wall biosynthesis
LYLGRVRVSCVVVDNGEPTLETCARSLLSQERPCDEIVIAPGPRSDAEVLSRLERLGARVMPRVRGVGLARVLAALSSRGDVVVSCDSDCVYDRRYVAEAERALLSGARAVMAGRIEPLEPSLAGSVEALLPTAFIVYEFALAFWRSALFESGAARELWRFRLDPRQDIGSLLGRLGTVRVPGMRVRARLPTAGFRVALRVAAAHGPLVLASAALLASAAQV